MFQNLLFDIDNTIFNFNYAEKIALENVLKKFENDTNYDYKYIKESYYIQKKI